MGIANLFSKRQQQLRAEPSDILQYDHMPPALRVQLVHIFRDGFGEVNLYNPYATDVEDLYKFIHDTLCREYGVFELNRSNRYEERLVNFILTEPNVERLLDATELSTRFIDKVIPTLTNYLNHTDRNADGPTTIEELNERFKQHAIGYRYEIDRIIKVDSSYAHTEIVKPTLQLLFNPKFAGANEEYMKAHEHYRHGRNKECLSEYLKAFESTMKVIFTEKKWSFDSKDTSSALVKVLLANNLIPQYMQSQFTSLRSLLDSGITTIRNRVAAHGQGASPTAADDETTRYGLNLAGTNIIYLIELSKI